MQPNGKNLRPLITGSVLVMISFFLCPFSLALTKDQGRKPKDNESKVENRGTDPSSILDLQSSKPVSDDPAPRDEHPGLRSRTDVYVPLLGSATETDRFSWSSSLSIHNLDPAPANVQFFLFKLSQSNPTPAVYNDTITAGGTRRYQRAGQTLFGEPGACVLRVVSDQRLVIRSILEPTSDSKLQASGSRLPTSDSGLRTSDSGVRTELDDFVKQFFAAVPTNFAIGAGKKIKLLGNAERGRMNDELKIVNSAQRTDYETAFSIPLSSLIVETTGEAVTVKVTAIDETGNVIASKDYTLAGFEPRPYDLSDFRSGGRADKVKLEVEVMSGLGKVIAFGSGLAQDPAAPGKVDTGIPHETGIDNEGGSAKPGGKLRASQTLSPAEKGLQGGSVTGSGVVGRVPWWRGNNVLGSSAISVSSEGEIARVSIDGPLDGNARLVVYGLGLTAARALATAGIGVEGQSESNYGVRGISGKLDGVIGLSDTRSGVYGGGKTEGVLGRTTEGIGVRGESDTFTGVSGESDSGVGVEGASKSNTGVEGTSTSGIGVAGIGKTNSGVEGNSDSGAGVKGASKSNTGVEGTSASGAGGLFSSRSGRGIEGRSDSKGGVVGISNSAAGVAGESNSESAVLGTSKSGAGVEGNSSSGIGVKGKSSGSTGVMGESTSGGAGVEGKGNPGLRGDGGGSGVGVFGKSASNYGVQGESASGRGVFGKSTTSFGVSGESAGDSAGVGGEATGTAGAGVAGRAAGARGIAVYGNCDACLYGVFGRNTTGVGVRGDSDDKEGVRGISTKGNGVKGESTSDVGVFGTSKSNSGVEGDSTSGVGVFGSSETNSGVEGSSLKKAGVRGTSMNFVAVRGDSPADAYGVQGASVSSLGVAGFSKSASGVYGASDTFHGVFGKSTSTAAGVAGVIGRCDGCWGVAGVSKSDTGVFGISETKVGVRGEGEFGVVGVRTVGRGFYGVVAACTELPCKAAQFNGSIETTGVKLFHIDHPLDPANKYLNHASIESSEMKNLYDGIVVLDSLGEAVAILPGWFEALNKDFRYQLTAVGAPGPSLYVAEEIKNNRFKIAGGMPGMKVSWQVTGNRQDAYAKAYPIEIEEPKSGIEQGHYLNPELFGQSQDKSVLWLHHPDLLQRIKEKNRPAELRDSAIMQSKGELPR